MKGRWTGLPENLRSVIELGGPFDLAAVAFSVVGGHGYYGDDGSLRWNELR